MIDQAMYEEISDLTKRSVHLSAECSRFNFNGQLGLAAKMGRELADVSDELARKHAQVRAISAAKPRTFSPEEKAVAEGELAAAVAAAAIPFSKALTRRAIGVGDEVARIVLDALGAHEANRARFNAAALRAREHGLRVPTEPAALARSSSAIVRGLIAIAGGAMLFRNRAYSAIAVAPGTDLAFVQLASESIEITQADISMAANALAGTATP